MSGVKQKKVSANFQISTESDLYRNIIEPKSSARCLSEFVHDLLDIYNSCSDVRMLIDDKIESRNPINQLKEQINRVNMEHQKTVMSANILNGFIDFKNSDIVGSVDMDVSKDNLNSKDIFESDGVLENLKNLLPANVQNEIKQSIEKRVNDLEIKLERFIAESRGTTTLLSSPSKVSQLVNNLETIYETDVLKVDEKPLDFISEEVKPTEVIVEDKSVSSVTSTIVESDVFEGVEEVPLTSPSKPRAFGKLMGNIKTN